MVDFPGLRPRYVSSWSPAHDMDMPRPPAGVSIPRFIRLSYVSQARPLHRRRLLLPRPRPSRHLLSKHQHAVLGGYLPGSTSRTEGPYMKTSSIVGTSLASSSFCAVLVLHRSSPVSTLSQELAGSLVADAAGNYYFQNNRHCCHSSTRPPSQPSQAAALLSRQLHRLQRSSNCR